MSKANFDADDNYIPLIEKDFSCDYGVCSKDYPTPDIYEAYAIGGSSDTLNINVVDYAVEIGLKKSGGSEIDNALFAQVFPEIKGKEAFVTTTKYFASDISSILGDYIDALEADGFTCDEYGGTCYKKNGGLIYICSYYSSYPYAAFWIVARDYFEDDLI
jgi:hypothetical protein